MENPSPVMGLGRRGRAVRFVWWSTAERWVEPVSEPKPKEKSFVISIKGVWNAYERIKANQGGAGVDGESIAEFEKNRKGIRDKPWNRLSRGWCFPPPVRAVEMMKEASGVRVLGVASVADRIVHTVVCVYVEPEMEPLFHPDSYGHRPGPSVLDAVGVSWQRCWQNNWVIYLDIRAFSDSIPYCLLMKAVVKHTDRPWVLLCVKRWLKTPLQHEDDVIVKRDRGTPQGFVSSPVLTSLVLHYPFDRWMARKFPTVAFDSYADDAVAHCKTEHQARRGPRRHRSKDDSDGSGAASLQDRHRVLQGHGSQGLVGAGAVHA